MRSPTRLPCSRRTLRISRASLNNQTIQASRSRRAFSDSLSGDLNVVGFTSLLHANDAPWLENVGSQFLSLQRTMLANHDFPVQPWEELGLPGVHEMGGRYWEDSH